MKNKEKKEEQPKNEGKSNWNDIRRDKSGKKKKINENEEKFMTLLYKALKKRQPN